MYETYALNVEWYMLHMNPRNPSTLEDETRESPII